MSLSIGTIQESVQVVGRGAAVEIETTKSDLSAVVNQEQLSELPVLNRGFVGLALAALCTPVLRRLAPGVAR